ncbi:MAG: flagellar hook protein FlgE [Clostridia bacterium]|nr:flagellar hook protein FlgE [Clostridia bacterium]
MMRSLYSGISGLSVHQTKMDVIGNNIANVNTTAYKSSRVTFTDVFSQKLAGASSGDETVGGTNPKQIGLGANIGSIDLQMGEGAAQRTDNDLDIKIEGDGFFIVSDASGYKFTRDGSFKVGANGYLTTSKGNYVMGWPADKDGKVAKTPVQRLAMITDEAFSVSATQTTAISYAKNLSIEDGDMAGSGITQLSTFYDSLGNEYTMTQQFYYVKNIASIESYNQNHEDSKVAVTDGTAYYPAAAGEAANAGKYQVINLGAGALGTAATTAPTIEKPVWVCLGVKSVTDSSGKEVNASLAFTKSIGGHESDTKPLTLAQALTLHSGNPSDTSSTAQRYPLTFEFTTAGTYAGTDVNKNSFDLNFGKGTGEGAILPIEGINATVGESLDGGDFVIRINMKDLTQYNSATTATSSYNGNKPGTMSSYSIGSDGIISAKYSNGETKILGQVALATFANSAGLEKCGDNLFQTTLNSGEFDGIGVSPTSVGSLNSGALEMSNVSLSTEFTEMITTQRGFQANSRIITTSDTLLEELVNLKR